MPDRPSFILTLEPLPDQPGHAPIPPEIRLRQLLKIALRGFRLRCTAVTANHAKADDPCPAVEGVSPSKTTMQAPDGATKPSKMAGSPAMVSLANKRT